MAETEFVVENFTQASFPKAITICKKAEDKYKDKDVKKAKYTNLRKKLEKGKEKLIDSIEKTKSITMASGNSFYQDFIEGKDETAVSLAWLGEQILLHGSEITAGRDVADSLNVGETKVDIKYDFVDMTKQAGNDLINGKGLSNGLVTTAIGVGLAEFLAHTVTSSLVKEGIMQSSMGLMGVLNLGVQNLPLAWQGLTGAIGSLWAFSPVATIAAGAFVALKVVPMIKNAIDKTKAKHKEAHAFESNMEKLVNEQAVLS